MDCSKAEEAMLQYIEKTIKPAAAAALARHLVTCASCKEYFMAFDTAMDAVCDGTLAMAEAPANFTESVMAGIRRLSAYHKKAVNPLSLMSRIVWGVCAVLLSAALIVGSNPEWLSGFPGVTASLEAAGQFLNRNMAWLWTNDARLLSGAVGGHIGLTALFLGGMGATLLVVLRQGEKGDKAVKA